MLANGIFLSQLIYIIQLWGGASQQYLITFMQKLQNRAARLVTKRNIYTPVKVLLTECGWLSVKQLIVFHQLLLIYKSKSSERPVHLFNKFTVNFGANTRQAASNQIKLHNRIRTDTGKYNFSYSAATIWNETSADVRNSPTLTVFKRNAKTWVKENISI